MKKRVLDSRTPGGLRRLLLRRRPGLERQGPPRRPRPRPGRGPDRRGPGEAVLPQGPGRDRRQDGQVRPLDGRVDPQRRLEHRLREGRLHAQEDRRRDLGEQEEPRRRDQAGEGRRPGPDRRHEGPPDPRQRPLRQERLRRGPGRLRGAPRQVSRRLPGLPEHRQLPLRRRRSTTWPKRYYLKLLEKDPKSVNALIAVGNCYANRGDSAKAQEWYGKVEFEKLEDATVLYNLGTIYYNNAKFEDALKFYRKAVEVQKDSTDALYQLGLTYLNLQKNAEAIDAFESYPEDRRRFREGRAGQGLPRISQKKIVSAPETRGGTACRRPSVWSPQSSWPSRPSPRPASSRPSRSSIPRARSSTGPPG